MIRKKNGIWKRDIDRILGRKEMKEQFWVILEESFLDVLYSCGQGEREDCNHRYKE